MTASTERKLTESLMGAALVLLGLSYLIKAFFGQTGGGIAIIAVEHRDKEPKPEAVGCLCVVGCSVNGDCPIHGDAAQRREKSSPEIH